MTPAGQADDVITYEAADRGANCAIGCTVVMLLALGPVLAIWGALRGLDWWMLGFGILSVLAGVGLLAFMRSARRGRWEISFDRDRRVVRLYAREGGQETAREFAFHEIAEIELEQITRDVSTGDDVPYLLPVFRLKGGEAIRLHERMSIKNPERAEETVNGMRALVGLIDGPPEDG